MKSRCSFILKASTALVLALIMLFGTVTTSIAAVVENTEPQTAAADGETVDAASESADEATEAEAHGAEGFFAAVRKRVVNLAETGAWTTYYLMGTDVGSNWTTYNNTSCSGLQFNSSGWRAFTSTKTNAVFKVWRTGWGDNGMFGAGATISSFDTNFNIYQYGQDGKIGTAAGRYAIYMASGDGATTLVAKLYRVFPTSTKMYFYADSNDFGKDGAYVGACFTSSASGASDTWVGATKCPGGDGWWYFTSPASGDYTKIKFGRFETAAKAESGSSAWNTTGELLYDGTNLAYKSNGYNAAQVNTDTHTHTITLKGRKRDYPTGTISNETTLDATGTPDWTTVATYDPEDYKKSAPAGYTFTDIYEDAACTTAAAASYSNSGDATYYALYTHNNVNVTVTQSGGTGTVAFTGMAASTINVTAASGTASVYYNKSGSITITPPSGYGFKITDATGSLTGLLNQKYNAAHTFSSQTVTEASSIEVTYECIPGVDTSAVSLKIGQTAEKTVTHNSYTHDTTTTYTSNDTSVATYVAGVITAVGPGDTTVKGTCQGSEIDTETVSVTVADPDITRTNMTNLNVNSETAISPTVTDATKPVYYYFEYSLDDSTFTTEAITSNKYIDVSNGQIIAKVPTSEAVTGGTTGPQTVYYRIVAGIDEDHITYTGESHSFTVTVAEPNVTFKYPTDGGKILTEDVSETASLNGLATYGLTAKDVTWSVTAQDSGVVGETVLGIHASTGKLTPQNTGTATIQAAVKFNDSYTKEITNAITVEDAALTVEDADGNDAENNRLPITAVYTATDAEKANDYDNTVKFNVFTNANETNYVNVTDVTVRKAVAANPITINKTEINTATSSTAEEVTVTANGLGTFNVLVEYWAGDTLVESLTQTVVVNVEPYDPWLTIYLNDNGDEPMSYVPRTSISNPYGTMSVYTYYTDSSTGDDVGRWVNDDESYTTTTPKYMVKIGTVGKNGSYDVTVYAQKYKKVVLLGALGTPKHNILFNSNGSTFYNTNSDYSRQTVDITPTGSCFENYTYFKVGTAGNKAKRPVTQITDYGCLKPSSASLTIEGDALPNSTEFSTTMTYAVTFDKYDGTGDYAADGYYTINEELDNVTLTDKDSAPVTTGGKVSQMDLTATATENAGTDTFSGEIYFQNDSVLKTPVTGIDDPAFEFIGLAYTSKSITVTDVDSTIHLCPVAMDTDSYAAIAGSGIKASGTKDGNTYSNKTSDIENDLGEDITISTGNISGYTFVGYYKTTEALASLPADTAPVVTTSSYTFKTNEIQGSAPAITSNYYVYAMYRKIYSISIDKSYTYYSATHITQALAAPAKRAIITRDGNVVATYNFNNAASDTAVLAGDPLTADYKDGHDIPVSTDTFKLLAGDVVELQYTTLAASDKITGVYFDNAHTADLEAYYLTGGRAELTGAVVNQTKHYVTFTVTGNTKHISIELGNKHRITFKDKEGYKTTGMNVGGYYADGEAIDFTLTTASSKTCEYELGAPVICDELGAAIASPSITYNAATGEFTGTMPAQDIIIDLHISTNYRLKFGTKMLSDVVNNKTEIDTGAGTITISGTDPAGEATAALIATAASASAGPKNATGTLVPKGSEIVYSFEDVASSGYTFLGWYRGTADGPDLEEGLINESKTVAIIPTASTYVWALATRDFYIAGNFTYDAATGALKHKENTSDNNNATKWKTEAEYYLMHYDPVEDAYAITFKSFLDYQNNVLTSTRDSNDNTSGTLTDSAYETIFMFKCYRTKGDGDNTGNATDWDNISKYEKNYIQWPTDTKYNDHMYYGKMNGDGGSGMFEFSTKTVNSGYNKPVTLYFKPSAKTWYVKATRVWPDIYISDGYEMIDSYENNTTNTEVVKIKSGDTVYTTGLSEHYDTPTYSQGAAQDGYEQEVKIYNFKFNDTVTVTLSKTVDANHEVVGFVVYDLTDDRVYPAPATNTSGNVYQADIEVGNNKLYVCPVIWYKDTNDDALTINVNAAELDTNEWGDLLSCYPWYATGGSLEPNGKYPGQLMYPSDDAQTWTARIKSTDGSNHDVVGITFSNYTGNSSKEITDHTWLGRGVLSSGATEPGDVIKLYNRVARSSNDAYNKSNVSVQSYDYREPFAFFEYDVEGKTGDEAAVLSFSFKYGNNDVMKYYHNNLVASDVNIFTGIAHTDSSDTPHTAASGDYKLNESSFEPLTDVTGRYYADLNGNLMEDQPTPSFYVIAKGQAKYNDSGNLVNVGRSGDAVDTPAVAVNYPRTAKQEFAVQWYVYNASGEFITTILSAGYADDVDPDDNRSLIAAELESLGYAVNGKSVGISYDFPRYYTDTNIYRFEGQWYATKKTSPVHVETKVGIYSNGSFDLSESNSEAYGTTEAYYDYEKGSPTYISYVGTDSNRSYVKIALGDTGNSPVYMNASKDNFIGWYYKDQNGKMVKASDKYELFYPTIAGDSTYYAIYEVKANYTFIYLDRNGNKTQYVYDYPLLSCEIKGYAGNGNKANIPTYIWDNDIKATYNSAKGVIDTNGNGSVGDGDTGWVEENPYVTALREVNTVVSSYQYQGFTWPTAGSAGITPNSTQLSLQIDATCNKSSYLIYYDKVDASGEIIGGSSGSITVPSGNVLTFNENYFYGGPHTKVTGYDTSGVKYWSLDQAGQKPLTKVPNYGLVITHEGHIYAQTKELSVDGNPWKPAIESMSKTRKKTKGSDTQYLDFNSYFVNMNGVMFHDLGDTEKSKTHYGLIVAYDLTSGNYADTTVLTTSTLKRYIQYFATNTDGVKYGTIPGTNIMLVCYDYNNDAYISNRNRSDICITGDHASLDTRKMTVFTYVYDANLPTGKIALSSTQFFEGNDVNTLTPSQFLEGSTTVFQ